MAAWDPTELRGRADRPWFLKAVGCTTVTIILTSLLLYVLGNYGMRARTVSEARICRDNLRLLLRAAQMYADDYQERYAPAKKWPQLLAGFAVKFDDLRCPVLQLEHPGDRGYDYLTAAASKLRPDLLENVPVFAETSAAGDGPFASAPRLPLIGRHEARLEKGGLFQRGSFVAYNGGSVKFVGGGKERGVRSK